MAAIDDLINQVGDETLRSRLRVEVEHLIKEKKFGLVFKDHLPELTPIYNAKVRKGCKVALRDEPLTDLWWVMSVHEGKAKCENINSGETQFIAADDLVVVRQFGEPIFPALVPVDKVQNGPDDAPWHTLIEADNYHALQLLEYLYAGKVDCIYIDPPYNSGARDWKYNNNYVDANDGCRHSKWLAMMQRRLKLAKLMLNPDDSVLIVTIDEKEYLHLGLLLEQIFPDAQIQMISSAINPKGSSRNGFRRSDEYIFIAMFGKAQPSRMPLSSEWSIYYGDNQHDSSSEYSETQSNRRKMTPEWTSMMRRGTGSLRKDVPNGFYPIYVDPSDPPRVVDVGDPLPLDVNEAPKKDGLIAVLPIRRNAEQGRWQVVRKQELLERLEQGRIRVGRKTDYGYVINYLPDGAYHDVLSEQFNIEGRAEDGSLIASRVSTNLSNNERVPPTQWHVSSHNASENGSSLINTLLARLRAFDYAKSLYAVEDVLRFFVADKPNAIILDFFAGSGTTAHAVMRLNHQDKGFRQCICVTNNEVAADERKDLREKCLRPGDSDWERQGICQYITFPRLIAAVTGKTPDGEPIKGNYKFTDEFPISEGFPANLEYFRLDFLDKHHVALGRQFHEILPLLWLRAGAVGPRPELPRNQPLPSMVLRDNNTFAVLIDETEFADFAAELADRNDLTHAYLVTDSDDGFREMAGQLEVPNVIQLYRDYLENFVINKEENAS